MGRSAFTVRVDKKTNRVCGRHDLGAFAVPCLVDTMTPFIAGAKLLDIVSIWVVQKEFPHYGLKEHASIDTNQGFILTTTMTLASVNDTIYLPYCTVYSRHTKQPIEKVYADKGYAGKPNRDFMALNKIADGIMRKKSTTTKLIRYEIIRNKQISKVRYIVEQYFGFSHLHYGAKRARFTDITKNKFDTWYRLTAYNIRKRLRTLAIATGLR